MTITKYSHKRIKRDIIVSVKLLLILSIITAITAITADFVRFPEVYITTWRYQLHNDIKQGKADAISYYNNTYIANNKDLFNTDITK